MEERLSLPKVKPILPQKIFITKEHNYNDFIKKHYRVLPKLDLKKSENLLYPSLSTSSLESSNYFEVFSLLKIFKSLKFIRELNLHILLLSSKPYSPAKMIYFAKRMSNAHMIWIKDLKSLTQNYSGQSELWVKYAKRAQVFGYSCSLEHNNLPADPNLFSKSNHSSTFIRLTRYQPQIKDLTVQFSLNGQFLPKAYFRFERYPPNLERLSLKGMLFCKDVPPSSLHHLKSLKHFEILFHPKTTRIFTVCFIKQLISLPNLQSLGLSWSRSMELDPSLTFSKKTSFKSLTALQLCFQNEIANLDNIFGAFTECPLHHLKLQVRIKSDNEFIQIANFLSNFKNLERLQLRIICWNEFQNQNLLIQLVQQIDDLPLLVRLSVSIFPSYEFRSSQKAILPFTKLFTKRILLKSFKLNYHGFIGSKKSFLQTLKGFERHISTLRKLRIDIGKFELNQNESKTVLSFIQSLPKIRSLQFSNLQISSETFLRNLVEIIYQMPYLEKFAVGELSDQGLSEEILISAVERVLKKRGLRKFLCCTTRFYYKDGFLDKSLYLNLAKIQKINPYL